MGLRVGRAFQVEGKTLSREEDNMTGAEGKR